MTRECNPFRSSPVLSVHLVSRAPKKNAKADKQKTQQKKAKSDSLITKLVPYIPPEFIKETLRFFDSRVKLKGLLDIICSPRASRDTEADRLEYQRKLEEYQFHKHVRCGLADLI